MSLPRISPAVAACEPSAHAETLVDLNAKRIIRQRDRYSTFMPARLRTQLTPERRLFLLFAI